MREIERRASSVKTDWMKTPKNNLNHMSGQILTEVPLTEEII